MEDRTMQPTGAGYPIDLNVDYPDRDLNRLTTFFRIFVAIPILVILATVNGGSISFGNSRGGFVAAGGLLVVAPLLMIVFREKYPRWCSTGTSHCSEFTTGSQRFSSCCETSTHRPMKNRPSICT